MILYSMTLRRHSHLRVEFLYYYPWQRERLNCSGGQMHKPYDLIAEQWQADGASPATSNTFYLTSIGFWKDCPRARGS